MKLSEAMRVQELPVPQLMGEGYFQYDQSGKCVSACAIGQALIRLHGKVPVITEGDMLIRKQGDLWPELDTEDVIDPKSGRTRRLERVVWDLNDELQWTPEEIADWLEGQGY